VVRVFLFAAALCCLTSAAARAGSTTTGAITPFESARFEADPDVPCLASAVETGNPETGPSTLILKAPPGCVVPWHSHTAEEQLIVVRGTVLAEMTGHELTRLGPGGFAVMGSHMAHQFTCKGTTPCVMFVTFDRAYDIKMGQGQSVR
jgi:quercetin dioxygenase-like cupin family protein